MNRPHQDFSRIASISIKTPRRHPTSPAMKEGAAVDIGPRRVPPTAAADDLDDLFDYDVDDVFRDVDTNMGLPPQQKAAGRADRKEHTVGLGIDEEIKVSKKRAPVPKLDEERSAPTNYARNHGMLNSE